MGYEGLRMTSNEAYIFEDIEPYNPEFDMEQLKHIQAKIQDYTSGKSDQGLTISEGQIFLDWVTFNARNYAVRYIPESPLTASMKGQCATTQCLNVTLLRKLGLNVQAFNTADGIGNIYITEETQRRMQNGMQSPAIRHSVSMLELPLIDENGKTQNFNFLLDPTLRQFCLKENCQESQFYNNVPEKVAPDVGYFMKADNLYKFGVNRQDALNTENLAKTIISRGYCQLNAQTAKLYGDAFVRASQNLRFQNLPINKTGNDYIKSFYNNPMQMIPNEDMKEYLKLPSEQKNSFFDKIKKVFNKFFNKKTKLMLNSGEDIQEYKMPENKMSIYEVAPNTINVPKQYCQSDMENIRRRI